MILIFGFVDFAILSQLFAFGAVQFQVIATQYDVWKPFVGVGAGAAGAVLIFRRFISRFTNRPHQELDWGLVGLLLSFTVPWFFVSYQGPAVTSPSALMYVGTVLLGISQVLCFTNFEVIFSKQLTQHVSEVGNSVGTMFALYGISLSLSRFLGPFVTGFLLPIVNFENGLAPCTGVNGFDPNSTCCFQTHGFQTKTCELQNVNVWVPILIGLSAIAVSLGIWLLCSMVSYKTDNEQTNSRENDKA